MLNVNIINTITILLIFFIISPATICNLVQVRAPGPDTSTCTCTSQGQVWVAGSSPQLGGDQVQTLAQCSATVRWGLLSQDDVHSGNYHHNDHDNYNDNDDDARLCPACC